ncbi:conserved hypothetical protein [Leishmania major strain Friedlin]|uniref:Uncharacterized protein n=1 Tax=Leishmania major TaxID=5664 RepID=E9AC65_LEIMA|nr:conserved hypothetical protein [Leishmania major strain Friedlin]CAG9567140.1 hypothetical_protein_-_conserved [Leishmania major strain Friedlin]CBZ11879.1 conserved hypothetical protein [Leishmania major strain Friedlin]|eukprot:XP_003721596.1 conserved hypothetical protein [Leishmania major strain Friedlin]
MMSKAAFMMQDHVRRNYVMITDVCNPNTFFVRGRLPFPQGLTAMAVLFKNQRPADVYAHPYFIEKQSNPSQPSPQLHLTEESQGIMKVMSGLRYMRDDNTKLDNTMVVVTDYRVEVEGRMPSVPQAASTAPGGPKTAPAHDGGSRGAQGHHPVPGSPTGTSPGLTLEQRALLRRTVHHVTQIPGGGGDAGLGLGGIRSPFSAASRPAATPSAASASSSRSLQASAGEAARTAGDSDPSAACSGDAASTAMHNAMPGYSTFPTPEDCATDAWMSYRYLKAAIFGRRALEETKGRASSTDPIDVPALFEKRVGGYTVLYNPIEVNERTFVELLLKLQEEERVVKAIVVPTRPAWRHLQVWADIFPDAELITSGEVPLLPAAAAPTWSSSGCGGNKESADSAADPQHRSTRRSRGGAAALRAPPSTTAASATEWRGGCQDMGNGMSGLSFPEVDLVAEAALERQRADEAAAKARATAEAAQRERERSAAPGESGREVDEENDDDAVGTNGGGTATERERRAMLRRQQHKLKLREEMRAEDARPEAAAAKRAAAASPSAPSNDSGDPVDVLWHDVSFFTEKLVQAVGLRESDAWRLRILSPRATSSPQEPPVDVLRLTPTIELLRIPGDSAVEEYVLLDTNSNSLACTDLYHGEYADLDPVNSWMCRVWFKFMKRGDYKRTDLVPRYKWLQVLQQRSLSVVQSAIDDLTRRRPIKCVLSAHGTPPLRGVDAVDTLRRQWNLPPLHPAERPRDGRR